MSSLKQRKKAFLKLGEYLRLLSELRSENIRISDLIENFAPTNQDKFRLAHEHLTEFIEYSSNYNPWFTKEFLLTAIKSIGDSLSLDKIDQWLGKYENRINKVEKHKTIGVVMAGNLPLVGFHDYLSVLISGNRLFAKLSQHDNKLLPYLHQILSSFEPELEDNVIFTENKLVDFDAIIATGSDNTSRYFEYYFGKYPNIIRKNRSGVAVLNGKESIDDLENLADDIFIYFGLGCRNVSKLFIPKNYNFVALLSACKKYAHLAHHNKYANNYDYNKSIFLINKIEYHDNGLVLLKEDSLFSSPIAVLFFEYYDNIDDLSKIIEYKKDKIQCLVSNESFEGLPHLPFGKAQQPELWDYADGIDTLQFILSV